MSTLIIITTSIEWKDGPELSLQMSCDFQSLNPNGEDIRPTFVCRLYLDS
jgi:hypothetical protein